MSAIDRAALRRRYLEGKRHALTLRARGAPGSHLVRTGGLRIAVVPATPADPWFNLALAEGADEGALAHAEAAYGAAGVTHWSVATLDGDERSAAALESAGFAVEHRDTLMAVELHRLPERDESPLEVSTGWDPAAAGSINDRAFGSPDGHWLTAYGGLAPGAARSYIASTGGEPAAVVLTYDRGEDCVMWFVATVPEARGRGLASRLMLRALSDARARGCTTSTLEASEMGAPVYERLGYRRLGELVAWRRGS